MNRRAATNAWTFRGRAIARAKEGETITAFAIGCGNRHGREGGRDSRRHNREPLVVETGVSPARFAGPYSTTSGIIMTSPRNGTRPVVTKLS